jgi:hypothetical protein
MRSFDNALPVPPWHFLAARGVSLFDLAWPDNEVEQKWFLRRYLMSADDPR